MAIKKVHRGIIVWDFDGVLFETMRYSMDNRFELARHGVPEFAVAKMVEKMRMRGIHFTIPEFMHSLRKSGFNISERTVRSIFHNHLIKKKYYSMQTDKLLHRLGKRGFIQMILSLGSSSYQRKKMFFGCSMHFFRHFSHVFVTTRSKYLTLLRIRKQYPLLPLFFIDDTEEHLVLAKKYVPGIVTIRHSNLSSRSLKHVENAILVHAK